MLTGKLVDLRAVEPADYDLLWKWMNNPEVMLYWGRPGNTESRAQVAAREETESARGNSRKYIIEAHDGGPVGQIDYYDLDWQSRSAWVSVMIAEQEYWGGGYGTDAMRTILKYLFEEMGLHRVVLTVHETNTRAQRSYEKNGFQREGTLRDWAFFNGQWVNGIIMSVLASEFSGQGATAQS
jgi:RimJ/RimL family protein N-acetyltransferase